MKLVKLDHYRVLETTTPKAEMMLQTKNIIGLKRKIIAMHVRHEFWHIFLRYSAKQRREIIKFEVLTTT